MLSCIPGDGQVYPVLKQLTSKVPIITQIDGLLTPAECDFLVQKAEEAGFEASKTGGPRGKGRISALRTSRSSYLPPDDKVVVCIGARLATVAGMPADSLEQLQATSYATGQQYKNHHDDNVDVGSRGHQRRLKTIFAYLRAQGKLSAGECGGATYFDKLHQRDGKPLRVYPRAGSAAGWNNYDDIGKRDARTEHSGK